MGRAPHSQWKQFLVSPQRVLNEIESGNCIFISTGAAEPRTLLKSLIDSEWLDFRDLELIQLLSLGDAIASRSLHSENYRLKTFSSIGAANRAISAGRVDLLPGRFSRIPRLMEQGRLPIDVAFVQITVPNEAGYCSLGIAVDVARRAMSQASLAVGEINPQIPRTFGDTFVPLSDFDFLVRAKKPPYYLTRSAVDAITDLLASKVSSLIDDGSCLALYTGPLYEALGRYLAGKRDLGVHSPYFTDVLMDLVKSGAVTNRYKETCRGRCLTSYAMGTAELMKWLDRNPLVEFQGIGIVCDPIQIGRNRRFMTIFPADNVDLSGRIVLKFDRKNYNFGPETVIDVIHGTELSDGGKTIFALPSRDSKGNSNFRISVETFQHRFTQRETADTVVTEYGVASLSGRTVRERAQALIDIAHPEDRLKLVEQAKKKKVLYPDQIFLAECAHLYPAEIASQQVFKGEVQVRFRAIRPSDEEEMRRLFYRFSEEAVYYRYFSPITRMPHSKMQEYVNADCNKAVSIVGIVGEPGQGCIIAEARFVKLDDRPYADVAFVVDENYQGIGIGTHLFKMLIRLAKERGLHGFTADVLPSNKAMVKVFEKGGIQITSKLLNGIYQLTMPFESRISLPS
jgi:acyl-CoA hydrolase/RimJ/RimL family protein N-acetyltransferase